MSKFSFLAVPNIEGMRLWWYIQIFGIVVFFGVCLFFVVYFWLLYRRKQSLIRQLHDFDHSTQDFSKQLLHQKIQKTSGKTKLILFIEYLEKFVTTKAYSNVSELLLTQWWTQEEVKIAEQLIYTDNILSKDIESKIDNYFTL